VAYLVDGFNLIHAVAALEAVLREEGPVRASRALAAALGRWSALDPRRQAVVLVLDGGPGSLDPIPRAPGLTVRFRGHADQLLLELLEGASEAHVLVTRDRELVQAAARGGWHRQEDPGHFWRRVRGDLAALAEEVEKLRLPGPDEVAAWKALFEAEGVTAAPPVPPPPVPPPPVPGAAAPSRPPAQRRPAAPARRPAPRPPRAVRADPPHEEGRDRRVAPEEVQEWLDLFREPPSSR
jgi:hypothetical protein